MDLPTRCLEWVLGYPGGCTSCEVEKLGDGFGSGLFFQPLLGMIEPADSYLSSGLKAPTRKRMWVNLCHSYVDSS